MLVIPDPFSPLNNTNNNFAFSLGNQVIFDGIHDPFAVGAPVSACLLVLAPSEHHSYCTALLLIYLPHNLLELFWVSYLYSPLQRALLVSVNVLFQVEVELCLPVEEEVDILLLDIQHCLVFPLGVLVLVDQEGADTFKELSVMHVAVRNLVLHLKSFFEVQRVATLDLLEDHSHAERAQTSNLLANLRTKLCLT